MATQLPQGKCRRCKRVCRIDGIGNSEARPMRFAKKGYCPDCVLTQFIGEIKPDCAAAAVALPHVQDQLAKIFEMGQSDLKLQDINWETVVANWNMPFPE